MLFTSLSLLFIFVQRPSRQTTSWCSPFSTSTSWSSLISLIYRCFLYCWSCCSPPVLYSYKLTCRTTMKNKTPQAIATRNLPITITQPPSCPIKLTKTKTVARNFPHPQDMSIYSRCSDHWTHIRIPSSRNVEIRHNLAIVGRTCFPCLNT